MLFYRTLIVVMLFVAISAGSERAALAQGIPREAARSLPMDRNEIIKTLKAKGIESVEVTMPYGYRSRSGDCTIDFVYEDLLWLRSIYVTVKVPEGDSERTLKAVRFLVVLTEMLTNDSSGQVEKSLKRAMVESRAAENEGFPLQSHGLAAGRVSIGVKAVLNVGYSVTFMPIISAAQSD